MLYKSFVVFHVPRCSEQGYPHGPAKPHEVLDRIRTRAETGNTRLAVAALAAHIAATTNISLTGENSEYRESAAPYENNRIRHRNPTHAVNNISFNISILKSPY